jgi:uncharacterized membrane protein
LSLFYILLTLHLFGVAFWLGGAIYERVFLAKNIVRARGTGQELGLLKIMLSTETLFLSATLLVILTGVGMTLMTGLGFFQLSWLGLKQGLMVFILIGFALYIGPRMKKLKKLVENTSHLGGSISEENFKTLKQMLTGFDLVHIIVLINFLLAIWKPI